MFFKMISIDQKHPRGFPFFLSQYLWIAIFFIFLLIGVLVSPYQKIKPIKSKSSLNTKNIPPVLIMHLTDIHLNSYQHIRAQTFERALLYATKNNISKLINSGDLVDNKKKELSYGVQSKTDYPHYSSVLNKFMNKNKLGKEDTNPEFFSQDSVIDIPGNHDEYGVPSYNSEVHRVLDFSSYFQYLSKSEKNSERINLSTFWASRIDITDNIELISLNPFRHPTPHAKLGFWNHPTTSILDDIEKVLSNSKKTKSSKEKEGRSLFVQCHFPIRLMITNHKTSQTKLTLTELLEKFSVDLFLSGHLHPKKASLLHTDNGLLEVVGSDLKGHLGVGIISVDKGNQIFYHSENFNEIDSKNLNGMPNVIVLSPVPIEQLSSSSVFNSRDIEIRVIVFTNSKEVKLKANIIKSGKIIFNEDLSFDSFLNGNQALYVKKLTVPENGQYTFQLKSDTFPLKISSKTDSYEFDFFIGDEVKIKKELIYCFPNLVTTCFAGFVIFVVFNVFVTFPYHFDFSVNHGLNSDNLVDEKSGSESHFLSTFSSKLNEAHLWILGQSEESHYLFVCLFGPLLIRKRLLNLPLFAQILLFILALWPVCLPLIFMTIEGKFAMVWTYGYVCEGQLFHDVFGYIFAFIFTVAVSCVTTLFYSMISASFPWKLGWMWFDLVLYAICMIFVLFLDYYFVYEASYYGGCFTSPEFFLLPILFIVIGAILLFRKTKIVEESTAVANTGYPDLA